MKVEHSSIAAYGPELLIHDWLFVVVALEESALQTAAHPGLLQHDKQVLMEMPQELLSAGVGQTGHCAGHDLLMHRFAQLARTVFRADALEPVQVFAADFCGDTQADDICTVELFFIAGSGDDDVIRDHAGEIVGILRLRVFFVIDHVPHVAGAFFIEADGGLPDQRRPFPVHLFDIQPVDPLEECLDAVSVSLQARHFFRHGEEHGACKRLLCILFPELSGGFFVEVRSLLEVF